MFWRKKQPKPEAVAPEPRTLFSTDSLPMVEAAPLPTIIRQKVGGHGEAMDSAGLTSDAMHVAGIPEAQFGWYASQGFIGYQACAILAQHWAQDRFALHLKWMAAYKQTPPDKWPVGPLCMDQSWHLAFIGAVTLFC